MINDSILDDAHKHSRNNKEEINKSKFCGCFYCLNSFGPAIIREWIDKKGVTATCPYCKVDSVIGDASGFEITLQFLDRMHQRWFSLASAKKAGNKHEV